MNKEKLQTDKESTWCPGCPNFMILEAIKKTLSKEIEETDLEHEDISMAAGIGCHGKMFDYLNIGGVYSLHGRLLPTCIGMKLGNPNLTVIGFGGDGDTYSEGLSHFLQMPRYNPDMTMIVHNNQAFSLTTGQATPTSEKGFKTKAQPTGSLHQPMNPLKLAINAGASFVARVYPSELKHTTEVFRKAIKHDGFALVDVAFPCLIYHDTTEYIEENLYKLEETEHDRKDKEEALKKAEEWDYNLEEKEKIPIGILYQEEKETLTEKIPKLNKMKKEEKAWYQKP